MFFTRPTFILAILLLTFLLKKNQRQYTIHGYAQGTDYTVKYFAADSLVTKGTVDSILLQIDSSMSLYKPYSLINRFNAAETGMELDPHFSAVMRKAFEVYHTTKGKFDVTVKPLVQAWGFGAQRVTSFPDTAAIEQMMACVGMDRLTLKGSFLQKQDPCLQVDLNGIAQGYSVDVVADYLLKKGIKAFVVEIGGEIRVRGPKPDGTSFKIGIEGPADHGQEEPVIKHVVNLSKGAITTSGNYRKYIQQGSKRISHLIDAKTGYPLTTSMISVTVYAKDAITADGYDNALMAMDMDEAIAFVNQQRGMAAYLVYHLKDGRVADTLTAGFKKIISDKSLN
ncbi:FAD:protein FMN transferase [Pedobacter metabolipauper]|uniref:FAD:protein FMN transferase n=1 Tax=Pedobacter metabolipauper TaxID=425513 RepID=A0A4V3D1H6_9SPHI|nr:FAD:protein FMN transferase [Pedobacter metabolipauper]TDQ11243.1 thiamine biosynthesis lipoprotein [Pedobacter metabolipauper]